MGHDTSGTTQWCGGRRSTARSPCPARCRGTRDVEVRAVVAGLPVHALVAGPPEVGGLGGGRDEPVDLLPVVPTDVADPQLVGAGPVGERKGLRRPWATMRRALGSDDVASGFVGRPAPVAGSTRMTEPSSRTGSPLVRRSWLRSAPPSAVGGEGGPGAARRVPARVQRVAVLAPVDEVEARTVTGAGVHAPERPNSTVPTEWLGYCSHQSSTRTCSGPVMELPLAVSRDSRPLTTHPSAVAPGGVGHGSEYTPGVPHRGAGAVYLSTWS